MGINFRTLKILLYVLPLWVKQWSQTRKHLLFILQWLSIGINLRILKVLPCVLPLRVKQSSPTWKHLLFILKSLSMGIIFRTLKVLLCVPPLWVKQSSPTWKHFPLFLNHCQWEWTFRRSRQPELVSLSAVACTLRDADNSRFLDPTMVYSLLT